MGLIFFFYIDKHNLIRYNNSVLVIGIVYKMTLIDYFNAFQVLNQGRQFSANARSLYYAVLGEFNSARYPLELKLQNGYLQHLSGIPAASSFDVARNTLINAGVISHKRGVYRLGELEKPVEKSWKNDGKSQAVLNSTKTSINIKKEGMRFAFQ